ncbi:oxygenase MpaB family protein [Streptomyces sp. ODS28]|uniref:oxygenase MpaB family protein n=1 Tax=Streptomyces sp. ODS28 TaxID=3136688 RepID=UPI0031E66FD8
MATSPAPRAPAREAPAPAPSAVRSPRRGGMAWRFFGDNRNIFMGPQLLVLQVAHPVVGAGVKDHSNFRAEPWQRLGRTLSSLSTVIYGGQRAAEAEARRLVEVHKPMKGTDEQGRRYHALNPEAYHWVHATLVKGAVDGHRLLGRPLTPEQTEEYYREMRDVGRVWGLKEHHMPPDWSAFLDYYDRVVAARLEMNPSVQDVFEELTAPQKPPFRWVPGVLWRPLGKVAAHYARVVTVGGLPEELRERFGQPFTEKDARSLRRFARLVRIAGALTPPPLRTAGFLALAYWNTHKPGTDPRAREPLGAS